MAGELPAALRDSWHGPLEMLISRKLNNKAQNKIQEALSLIEMGQGEAAIVRLQKLSELLTSHVESPDQERARRERENLNDA